MIYKALILDDEFHGRENLKILIEELFDNIQVVETASNVFQAKLILEQNKPDIIFMDIQMDVLTGLDFLEILKENSIFKVVVTAYANYAKEALLLGAHGYLLKPIISTELISIIDDFTNFKKQSTETEKNLIIKHNDGISFSDFSNIIMVKAINNYCKIYFCDGTNKILPKTLKNIENTINNSDFFRVHKTYLVNLKNVKEYSITDGGSLVLSDGTFIKVAVAKRAIVKHKLMKLSISVNA